jgi:hypothetical protein
MEGLSCRIVKEVTLYKVGKKTVNYIIFLFDNITIFRIK